MRCADALNLCGWQASDFTETTEELSAVVRSWEERFAARLVMIGFDTLWISVGSPPTTLEHAQSIAAGALLQRTLPAPRQQGPGGLDPVPSAGRRRRELHGTDRASHTPVPDLRHDGLHPAAGLPRMRLRAARGRSQRILKPRG
ncbi:DUF4253 domain-containing protein [Nocardia sp. CA-151230]|uniref:DUF4253 domain-containing protein n=1 Tax=Nocardia sp. CA-151230 TaxID=3239982 RepID=UPI003D8B1AAB